MKHDASTIHAKVVIRLEGPWSSNQPYGRLPVAHLNRTRNHPEKRHHTCKHGLRLSCTWHVITCIVRQSLEEQWKEIVDAASDYATSLHQKGKSLVQRAVVQHIDSRQGEKRITNPEWITHLLRTVFANSDVECNGRAKTPTINWHEEWNLIQ